MDKSEEGCEPTQMEIIIQRYYHRGLRPEVVLFIVTTTYQKQMSTITDYSFKYSFAFGML